MDQPVFSSFEDVDFDTDHGLANRFPDRLLPSAEEVIDPDNLLSDAQLNETKDLQGQGVPEVTSAPTPGSNTGPPNHNLSLSRTWTVARAQAEKDKRSKKIQIANALNQYSKEKLIERNNELKPEIEAAKMKLWELNYEREMISKLLLRK